MDPLSQISGGGDAPVVDPVAPAAPAAPAVDPITPPVPPAEDATDAAEDAEWAAAAEETFPGLKSTNKEKQDGKPDPAQADKEDPAKTATEAGKTPGDDGKGADPKDPAAEAAGDAAGDEGAEEESSQVDADALSNRITQRETAKELEVMKSDVRERLFADVKTELRDAQGDPINTVEDVMQLVNPQTGEGFTREEAGMWLLHAQQDLNKSLADTDKQIEQIAEVNLDLRDQSDLVLLQYGELLKQMPELQKEVWAEYEKTLVIDPKTKLILKAPVSLSNFYKLALKPYADVAEKLEAQETERAAQEAKDKAEQEEARKANRADRSDIYKGAKSDIKDPEADEWGAAEAAVFGPNR